MVEGAKNVIDGVGDVYHFSGLVWRRGYGRPVTSTDLVAGEIFSPCAGAALYRREALAKVTGFDEDYFCYVEDVDLGFRLRLAGFRSMYVPDAVVHHVGSATTGGQHSDFAVYHGHRNLVWTYVKNMPGWLFWACLPSHIAMNLLAVGVFAWRGKGKVILRAKRDALLGLPGMWRKRRDIQSRRVAPIGEIWRVLDKRLMPGGRDKT
jgi:GT2 family glycosyltransferase